MKRKNQNLNLFPDQKVLLKKIIHIILQKTSINNKKKGKTNQDKLQFQNLLQGKTQIKRNKLHLQGLILVQLKRSLYKKRKNQFQNQNHDQDLEKKYKKRINNKANLCGAKIQKNILIITEIMIITDIVTITLEIMITTEIIEGVLIIIILIKIITIMNKGVKARLITIEEEEVEEIIIIEAIIEVDTMEAEVMVISEEEMTIIQEVKLNTKTKILPSIEITLAKSSKKANKLKNTDKKSTLIIDHVSLPLI